ncbi:uncharacterized protein BDV17DRAFT_78788 [Aspergillus undulatus]|uniref:uncharacterized protein n=1 Tax=Aspergillus undulatus TaxID=1810928 RepID=UPI003CCD388B
MLFTHPAFGCPGCYFCCAFVGQLTKHYNNSVPAETLAMDVRKLRPLRRAATKSTSAGSSKLAKRNRSRHLFAPGETKRHDHCGNSRKIAFDLASTQAPGGSRSRFITFSAQLTSEGNRTGSGLVEGTAKEQGYDNKHCQKAARSSEGSEHLEPRPARLDQIRTSKLGDRLTFLSLVLPLPLAGFAFSPAG